MIQIKLAAAPLRLFLTLCLGIACQLTASAAIHPPVRTPARRWGANTSGPFYTGTAEVEPAGSLYLEPFVFDNRKSGAASDQYIEKMAIGLGHKLEFDTLIPLTVNSLDAAHSPTGHAVREFGPGDTQLSFKYALTPDSNTYRFFARPAVTLTANFLLPSGNTARLNPKLGGADQFGNGTFEEGLGVLIRKRFRPFVFYSQMVESIVNSAAVGRGYGFNNQINIVPSGKNLTMVDGNLFSWSAALEDVFSSRHGIGALLEATGEVQSKHNLFLGKATAPPFSYLSLAPELEFTWPAGKRFAITWGGGVTIPVERHDYPRMLTPMMTMTFYFNGPNGGRSSD